MPDHIHYRFYGDVADDGPGVRRAAPPPPWEFLTKHSADEVLLSAIRQANERSRACVSHEGEDAGQFVTPTHRSAVASGRSWRWWSAVC